MSAPRYPSYKDSGVAWLGQVPLHWQVRPLKWEIDRNDGGVWGDDPDGADDTIVLRSTEQTVDGRWRMDDPAPRKLSATERATSLLAEGDLVVTKSSGSSLHIGKTTLVTAEIAATGCCYSNFMQRVRTRATFLPKLAWYVLNNDLARLQFDLASNSTTGLANLNGTMIGGIVLPVAPINEQVSIVDFLDSETAKIDALVDEQRRLIGLLKEKRQAVISRAVTKGLNPHVPMKGSMAGWIGEAPQHWRVSALGYVARIDSGSTPDRANPHYWGGSIPWVKTGEVNYDPITQAEECITEAGLQGSSAKVALPGTLLMAMYGQGVTRGRVALLEVPAAYNQACAAIHFDMAVAPSFGRYFFMAAYQHVRDGGNETSQMNLSTGVIQKFKIAVPPLREQMAIVDFLDRSIREIELLIGHADASLLLLSERRSALISAAVIGKIDVRGLVLQPEAVAA